MISIIRRNSFFLKFGAGIAQATFTGHEYDEENGLQYFGARYLDNEVGKFVSIDPATLLLHDDKEFKEKYDRSIQFYLSDPQGLNSYAYALNNPVKNTDPDGEIVPLLIGAYILFEVGMTAWDAHDAGNAWFGENTSNSDKAWTGGTLVAGLVLPGPGKAYTKPTQYIAKEFLTSQSEIKRVINSATNAFQNAVNEAGYSKFLQRYKDVSVSELQKAIKSFDKVIDQHIRKLENPLDGAKNFNSLNQFEKGGLINKWKTDLFRNQSYRNILDKLLDKK